MTGMATYMLAGLDKFHGFWSYQTSNQRPPDVADAVVHHFFFIISL